MKRQKEILLTLQIVWPLLIGMFMVMVGSGLQGTLLALRAEFEGFPVSVIGIIMSMYYVGYLGGWYIVPRLVNKIGYIRVFSGFASLASTTVLLQGVFIDPLTWAAIRCLSGVCFVSLFIVAESWLNDIAPNKSRGRIFSAYMFVVNGGMFTGQFLINLAPIETIGLFVLVSVLVSLSLIPVTLASKVTESFEEPESLPFKKIVGISQHAVLSVLVAGFTGASMLTIGPVYGSQLGLDISEISIFLASFILGCATLPLFAGWLSDKLGRRIILIAAALIGTIVTTISVFTTSFLLPAAFIFGGCMSSSYSVAIAMMNDRLKPKQRTSATASLILINGMSSCIGPVLIGTLMQIFGPHAFFVSFTLAFAALFAFGVYRRKTGTEDVEIADQGEFQAVATRAAPTAAQLGDLDG